MTDAIDALIDEAKMAMDDARPADARNAYAKAAALSREQGQPLLRAHALRHLSDLDRSVGRAEMALASADQALALYQAQADSDPLDRANALRLAAMALEDLRRPRDAAKRWEAARALYAERGVEAGVAECDDRLSAGA